MRNGPLTGDLIESIKVASDSTKYFFIFCECYKSPTRLAMSTFARTTVITATLGSDQVHGFPEEVDFSPKNPKTVRLFPTELMSPFYIEIPVDRIIIPPVVSLTPACRVAGLWIA
jgi:hypothetical protein